MGDPALPKLRWLLAGAVVAGVWVVESDSRNPRPPARVPYATPWVNLPQVSFAPPPRPSQIITGSIGKPDLKLKASTRVRLRAQARADAAVIDTLEPGSGVREIARSGKWRLVSAAGRRGWVRADYLTLAPEPAPRPKAAVGKIAAKAAATPKAAPKLADAGAEAKPLPSKPLRKPVAAAPALASDSPIRPWVPPVRKP